MDDLSSALPCPEDSRDATPYPDIGEALKSSVSGLSPPAASLQGSRDHYHRVVVMLDSKTRVTAADIQWIIQKRLRDGRHAWG